MWDVNVLNILFIEYDLVLVCCVDPRHAFVFSVQTLSLTRLAFSSTVVVTFRICRLVIEIRIMSGLFSP